MSSRNSYILNRRRYWEDAIKRCGLSGLSVRQFCKEEGISTSRFYHWRSEIADGKSQKQKTIVDFIEVKSCAVEPVSLNVELPCGSVIRVNSSAQIDLLTSVLSSLREKSSC